MKMANHLNGRRIRIIVYVFSIITIYLIPISYIESRSFCLWYNLFGVKCFGCGMTRAFFNFSRLNIEKALNYNPMIVLIIIPIYMIIKDIINIFILELRKFKKS
ncbi:DUF2752 domain-containing protein [Paraclostridium ghonii]|uniref:DUF2752 domain-containing protein n=1 Tax=Paraclostridium ghonii TaxID=29358 RepID=UPI00352475E4